MDELENIADGDNELKNTSREEKKSGQMLMRFEFMATN